LPIDIPPPLPSDLYVVTLHSRIRRHPARYVTPAGDAAEAFGDTGPLTGPHCRHGSDGRPLIAAAPVVVGPWQPLTVATATALETTLTGMWRSVGIPRTTDTLAGLLHGIAACCREWVAVGDTTVLVTTLDDPAGHGGAPWVFLREDPRAAVTCSACQRPSRPNEPAAPPEPPAEPTSATTPQDAADPARELWGAKRAAEELANAIGAWWDEAAHDGRDAPELTDRHHRELGDLWAVLRAQMDRLTAVHRAA
jgi:hypothetical protein